RICCCFFFFQAEDGIRDFHVTGVQTCALPISVEHVMAALRALRIDNAVVQLDGEEPPFADGAAAAFVRLIRRAGTELLDAPRRARPLRAPAWAAAGDAYIVALPADEFRVTYTFVSDHPALGTQFADFPVDPDVFETE